MTVQTTNRPEKRINSGDARPAALWLSLLLTAAPLSLTGCQHRYATETLTDWWHGYEGGEIAKLRPPPPGQNQPYPHVGRTPSQPPELPSPEARAALTERLEEQRNLAQRESAANGVLPGPAPHPASQTPHPVPIFEGQGSSTVTAAGQPTTMPGAVNPTGTTDSTAASKSQPGPATRTDPEAPLPAVVLRSIPPTPPGALPMIGNQPPPPPRFPGFSIPWDATIAAPVHPDIDASTPEGILVRFRPSTDQIVGNTHSIFNQIANDRGQRKVVILGFGATMSGDAGLTPSDQSREIALGTLRARAIANGLIDRGVPATAILLRAEAIGDGARVTFVP